MISSGGGTQPRWRRDGKELFFIAPDGKLIGVEVRPMRPEFQVGSPKPLFQTQIWGAGGVTNGHRWDVAPDGQRFVFSCRRRTQSLFRSHNVFLSVRISQHRHAQAQARD